jgi:predicted RND superfamily exporter protein
MISYFYQKYSSWILWGVALSFPLIWYQAESIRSNNDIETWLPRDTDVRQSYEDFKDDFGGEEVVVIGVRQAAHDPALLEAVAGRLERQPGVRQCWTPDRMLRKMTQLGVPEEEARRRLAGLLTSETGEMQGLVVLLSERGLNDRDATVAEIRESLSYCDLGPADVALTGAPVIVSELDRLGNQKTNRRFFAITILISMGLLYHSFRHWGMTLATLGITLWGIYLNQAILAWCGGEMNFILGSLSVMVMIFTLSIVIHFVSYYVEAVRDGAADPLFTALKESWNPCFLSTLTTLLGLVSLNVSTILPVSQFGYAAAVGSIVALVVGLGITPALLVIWPNCTVQSMQIQFDFYGWGGWVARNRGRLLAAGAILLAVTSGGIARLKPDIDPIEFLPRNSQVLADLKDIEAHLTDVDSLEAVVDFHGADLAFLDQLHRVRELEAKIQAHPSIRHTLSLATFFPTEMPDSPLAAARLLSTAQSQAGQDGLVADNQQMWRISARVRRDKHRHPVVVMEELKQTLAGEPVRFTGVAPLLKSAQAEIFAGFWQSFTGACLTIWIVMFLSLRSFTASVIAMVPNIVPIWLVFGIVGYLGVPVDIGMMMTGSIALGISVDCTFHFLVHHREAVRRGATTEQAVRQALAHSGEPMFDSTIISSLGMLALCLSSFTPTARFGCLMAAQMVASLLGELVFLPALLCVVGSGRPKATPKTAAVDSDDAPEFRSLPLRPHFHEKTRARAARR